MATYLHVQSLGRLVHIDDIGDPANVGSDGITIEDISDDIEDSESEGDDDSPLGTL